MSTPIPVFPTGIASNANLKVAANLIQTTLKVGCGTADTILFVTSTAGFVANCLVSIDKEIIAIDSVSTGVNPSLNVNSTGRGFDGTTAASHSAGAKISILIDAWHHNVLSSEVQAIETFLGPNGQNIGGQSVYLVSKTYDFPAQTPGGSLAAGNNTITLAPVPAGVNGADQNHYVYISAGTGTAEAALITGGTAVSGAPSGTLIINCANTHSGAWTIKSATAGIQEAVNTLGTAGGMIVVPRGSYSVYATITIASGPIRLCGVGRRATTLTATSTTTPLISLPGSTDGNYLTDFALTGPGSAVSTAYAISAVNQADLHISSVAINAFGGGISFTGTSYTQYNVVRDTNIFDFSGSGVFINSAPASALLDHVIIAGNGGGSTIGVQVVSTVGINIKSSYISYCSIGLDVVPGTGQSVGALVAEDLYVDGYFANAGIGFNFGGAGQVQQVICVACQAWGMGQYGIAIAGNMDGAVFTNCLTSGNGQVGIWVDGGINLVFIGCVATGNSTASVGTQPGMLIAASRVQVIGGTYAQAYRANNSQICGIYINSSALTNILIDGAAVTPNVGPATPGIGGAITGLANSRIINCTGYNPVGASAITVGASPFTYTAGASPEVVYIYGGTVSNVSMGSTQIASSSPASLALHPNGTVTVTYTVAPTMVKDVQ